MVVRNISRRIFTAVLVCILLPVFNTSASADPTHGFLVFTEVNYGNIATYQASTVEISPDGNFLYLGVAGGTMSVFRRVLDTGRLLRVQEIQDEDFGLGLGFYGISDIDISPDGQHVYTCSIHGNTLVILNRNIMSGEVTYIGHMEDGVGGVNGLAWCESIAITPDGKYVYAAGADDNAIALFARNSTTGLLTYINALIDGTGSVQDIAGVNDLAISPDGHHLYATANDDDAITSFQINSITGALTYVNHIKDTDAGVDGLNGARGVTVSPDGQHVYVMAFFDDSITTFSRNAASGAITFVETDKQGGTVDDGLDGATDVVVSPDGQHVYAVSYADDAVVVFRRDVSTGRLVLLQHLFDDTIHEGALEGALQMALSPDGKFLYVVARIEGAMSILRRNPETGFLTYVHTEDALINLDGPVGAAVSPDGRNVYITSNNSNRLTVCSRDPITGKLRELENHRDNSAGVNGLDGARAVAVSPDGRHVYVAGNGDNGIAIFNRNTTNGTLVYSGVVLNSDLILGGLTGIQSLTISPDGGYLYAVSTGDDALVLFSRNPTSGALTYQKRFVDGVGGVNGLNDAYHVAVSSGGKHVYVAGFTDDAVAHFEWDKVAGFVFKYALIDGLPGGGDQLNGANSLVLSPDDKYLYVASRNDSAISVFSVGASYGTLVYQSMVKDGTSGVDGLWGARGITMNASGTYVYVASQYDDAIAVFAREQTTGNLTYFTSIKDTDPGIDGLNTANGIAISPTFNHIYVTSYDDDAVSVFNHFWGIYTPIITRD